MTDSTEREITFTKSVLLPGRELVTMEEGGLKSELGHFAPEQLEALYTAFGAHIGAEEPRGEPTDEPTEEMVTAGCWEAFEGRLVGDPDTSALREVVGKIWKAMSALQSTSPDTVVVDRATLHDLVAGEARAQLVARRKIEGLLTKDTGEGEG